jgi:hypothetical protein
VDWHEWLAEPTALGVDRSGRVFETDWKVDGIQVFAADGRFERIIGRSGQGPGEFKAPIGIALRGDTIFAFASNQRRITIVRSDGTLLSQWRADYCCGLNPSLDGAGNVLLSVNVRIDGANRRGVARLRRDGSVIDTLVYPPEPPVKGWDVGGGSTYSIPFSAYTVSTTDTQGRRISGNSTHYALAIALHGSDTARVIELPGSRAEIPAAVIDSVFAPFAKRAQTSQTARRSDIPTLQPYFTGVHVDETGNIWLNRPAPDGAIAEFDVTTPDGRFLGSVAAPQVAMQVPIFRNGRMYCVAESADGDLVIQVYRIDKGTK